VIASGWKALAFSIWRAMLKFECPATCVEEYMGSAFWASAAAATWFKEFLNYEHHK
jgi:hypothetical protein